MYIIYIYIYIYISTHVLRAQLGPEVTQQRDIFRVADVSSAATCKMNVYKLYHGEVCVYKLCVGSCTKRGDL